jgi:hypothetical protein
VKTNVHRLVGWKLFCAACREGEDGFCPAATRRQLNRFYARYRLAAHFEAVHPEFDTKSQISAIFGSPFQ